MKARHQWWVATMALLVGVGLGAARSAGAQSLDHLKCYTIKDYLPRTSYTADLQNQFGFEQGCRVIVPAKYLCAETTKLNVQPPPPGGGPTVGPAGHFLCYVVRCPKPVQKQRVHDQFGSRLIKFRRANLLCTPTEKVLETDSFPNSQAVVTVTGPGPLSDTVTLSGPTTVVVNIGVVEDADGDGREQVQTEIVSMTLTGTSAVYGPLTVRVRDSAKHPNQRSTGEIEETANNTPEVLDIPPFTATGSADSFFDVFFEIEVANLGGAKFHNHTPKHMQTTITHKPPAEGEVYQNPDVIELFDENETLALVTMGTAKHTPNPAPCRMDPQTEMCGGACSEPNTACVFTGTSCECVPSSAVCEPSCGGSFCPGPQQHCEPLTCVCR